MTPCHCIRCLGAHPRTRMVGCPVCGNKRCPHANDHANTCTGSNEIGQAGSSWEHVKPFQSRSEVRPVTPARPRPPKSLPSRFYGLLRSLSGALGRRPRWFHRWAWEREFDALCVDQDRARLVSRGGGR